jgi:hypothetical protein
MWKDGHWRFAVAVIRTSLYPPAYPKDLPKKTKKEHDSRFRYALPNAPRQ